MTDNLVFLIIGFLAYALGWAVGYYTCASLVASKLRAMRQDKAIKDLRPRDQ